MTEQAELNKKIAVGAAWSVITRLSIKSLGFISTIILARLLFPEDFGLLALTMAMVAFFEIFASFSFDVNIIQKEKVTDSVLNSAWTCKIISGIVVAILLITCSPFISEFFNDERLTLLVIVVAVVPVLKGFENIGFVLFRKHLNLKKEFRLEVVSKLVSFFATIISAYVLKSYWALVIGILTNTIFRVLLSYIMHSYRPKLCLENAKELMNFSKWLLLNNLLIFFNHKITDFMIGNRSSAEELGYYSISYEISNLPTTELVFPLSRAIFPGYSLVKTDLAKMKKMFLDFTTVVVFITAPISFGIFSTATEAVNLLLGEKWQPVIPIISLLALYGFTRCAVQNIGSVFVAIGKPKIPVLISTFRIILITPILFYLVNENGAEGAALGICLVSLVTMPISYVICAKYLALTFKDVVGIFAFPVISSLLMTWLIFTSHSSLNTMFGGNDVLVLLAKVMIGMVVYLATLGVFLKFAASDHIIVTVTSKVKAFVKDRCKRGNSYG